MSFSSLSEAKGRAGARFRRDPRRNNINSTLPDLPIRCPSKKIESYIP
jgi:hypothetical protein